jgi:hypothetical protein
MAAKSGNRDATVARGSGASRLLAFNVLLNHSPLLAFYAPLLFCRSSPE